tara:strand:- start:2950 stop:3108 length:159 start_codon:yes stop_codon:yes gene_type:complete
MRLTIETNELMLMISALESIQIMGKDSIQVAETLIKLYKARDKDSPSVEIPK